jgi:DNA polymerase III delta subunit
MATREKAGDVRVVLLSGEEFQRLERLNELLQTHVDQATRDFNYNSLYPQDLQKFADVRRFADLVTAYPMMAARRVVVVRFFDDVLLEMRKKVAEALKDIPETTLVIIEGEKAALTPKPTDRHFRAETFKPIYESKLPDWIRGRFAKRGKRISESAVVLMMNNVGIVPLELDAEIGKVTDMVRDKAFVTEEDVERIVGKFRRFTVYALQNAVGMGDFPEAARVLQNLMEMEKGRETWYVMSLATHIMKLGQYNMLLKKGSSPADALKELGEPEFLWKVNRKDIQARNFKDPDKVRRALETLADADSRLKSSSVDKSLLMELVLPAVMP